MATKKTTTTTRAATGSAKKVAPAAKKRKPPTSAKKASAASTAKKTKVTKPRKPSALDAAAKVLGEVRQQMNCKEMVEAMADRGYWSSPNGKTPSATLYSAILREINAKGKEARFQKTERGKFTLASKA